MKPRRIELKRIKGYQMPPNTVSVARPSKLGNPYRVWKEFGAWWLAFCDGRGGKGISRSRRVAQAWAVELYATRFLTARRRHQAKKDLRGKNLACYCRLCERHKDGLPLGDKCDQCEPCHVDPLLEVANGGPA